MNTPPSFSIVMAIKCHTHLNGEPYNNLERFIHIGLRSYQKYLKKNRLVEFIVIAPKEETKLVTETLQKEDPTMPWNIINEDTLLSKELSAGWQKQQTSKLAVSQLIKTPYYLIVDDDTFLVREFGIENFFVDETQRLIINTCEIDFPMWLLWSCNAAGIDIDKVQNENEIMAITPEIFVTEKVKELVGCLEKKWGTQWQVALGNNKFTEYTLYWSYLVSIGEAHQLYSVDSKKKLYAFPATGPEHNVEERMQQAFSPDNKDHYFSFVQSSLQLPLERLYAILNKYL